MKMTAELEKKWNNVCDDLRDAGLSVVAVVASYEEGIANFSTRLDLIQAPDLDLTEDHIVLDVLREISHEWSAVAHSRQK